MKHKNIMAIVILLCCLMFGGCENTEDIEIHSRSGFAYDGTYIAMDTKFKLKDYDKEYTENGCIVHIYYETKGA